MLVIAGGVFLGLTLFLVALVNLDAIVNFTTDLFRVLKISAVVSFLILLIYWDANWAIDGFPRPGAFGFIVIGVNVAVIYGIAQGLLDQIDQRRANKKAAKERLG